MWLPAPWEVFAYQSNWIQKPTKVNIKGYFLVVLHDKVDDSVLLAPRDVQLYLVCGFVALLLYIYGESSPSIGKGKVYNLQSLWLEGLKMLPWEFH